MGYLSEPQVFELNAEIIELRRLINGYISYLKKSKRGISEPGAQYFVKVDEMEPISSEALPNH